MVAEALRRLLAPALVLAFALVAVVEGSQVTLVAESPTSAPTPSPIPTMATRILKRGDGPGPARCHVLSGGVYMAYATACGTLSAGDTVTVKAYAPTPLKNDVQLTRIRPRAQGRCLQEFPIPWSGYTCQRAADANGLSLDQFYDLNVGRVDRECSNLPYPGKVCVRHESYPIGGGGQTSSTSRTSSQTNQKPNTGAGQCNPHPRTTTNCGTYYTVITGDTCGEIVGMNKQHNLNLEKFYEMNPSVNNERGKCQGLMAGYCVCLSTKGK